MRVPNLKTKRRKRRRAAWRFEAYSASYPYYLPPSLPSRRRPSEPPQEARVYVMALSHLVLIKA